MSFPHATLQFAGRCFAMEDGESKTAQDVMRQDISAVAADTAAADALARMHARGHEVAVSMADDEVSGVAWRDTLEEWVSSQPMLASELIGNLVCDRFRICRPDDDLALVSARLRGAEAKAMIVIDARGRLKGLIAAADLS